MNSIRTQLTRKLLLSAALLVAAGSGAVYWCARAALQNEFDAALRAKAQALTTLTEQKNGRVEIDFSDEHMRGFERNGTDFFELSRLDNSVVERSHSLGEAHLPQRRGTLERPSFWDFPLADGQAARAIGIQFRPQGSSTKSPPVEVALVVASVRRELDRTLTMLLLVLGGFGALLLAVTALVVPRVLHRELAPLQRLADESVHIDATSLSVRFPVSGLPAELAPISARLNELLARLELAFERERQFSADLAHEFRTPIAELRSLAELAVKLPEARPPDTDRQSLGIALQMEKIVTRLLALARSENGQGTLTFETVMLGPLVDGVVRSHRDKANQKQLTLNVTLPAPMFIKTDRSLFQSILTNLVENAVEYSPPGAAIEVTASIEENQFALRVINPVDSGLTPADLPRLFERFWRKDAARTDSTHSGLGLPLARALARQLDCELTADLVKPGRLALTLTGKCESGRAAG